MSSRFRLQPKKPIFIALILAFSLVSFPATDVLRAAAPLPLAATPALPQPSLTGAERARTNFKHLPLRFESNTGQRGAVRFTARTANSTVFLTSDEAIMCLSRTAEQTPPARIGEARLPVMKTAVIHVKTLRANPQPKITGMDELPGKTNYVIGNDPKKWRTNIPGFAKVKYENIYPGIDLIYYGNQEGKLEYDFKVSAGADPRRIALSVEGAEKVRVDEGGDLLMQTAVGEVRQHRPRIYQEIDGARREVGGGYRLLENDPRPTTDDRGSIRNPQSAICNPTVGFEIAGYDTSKELIIDPEIIYSTYLSGSGGSVINSMAVDATGAVYVTGSVNPSSPANFPLKNALQPTPRNVITGFIAKLSADGNSLVYSTYFGGTGGDQGWGIAVDASGAAYVAGQTTSNDFPLKNPIQGTRPSTSPLSNSLFVAKLSADGSSLLFSTYLGGSGNEKVTANCLTLDSANNVLVFGSTTSTDFPQKNPVQASFPGGNYAGFLSKIASDGSAMLFSSYIGDQGNSRVTGAAVDPATGAVYTAGAFDAATPDAHDSVFINKLDSNELSNLRVIWATAIKLSIGSGEYTLNDPEPDSSSLVFAFLLFAQGADLSLLFKQFGQQSGAGTSGIKPEPNASTTKHVLLLLGGLCLAPAPPGTCNQAAVMVDFDENLQPLGYYNIGSNVSFPEKLIRPTMAADSQGALYVAGSAPDRSLPLLNPLQGPADLSDGYISVFAQQLAFATYLGGSKNDVITSLAVDPQGNIYVAGSTESADFPTKGGVQPNRPLTGTQSTGFITKISAVGPFQTGPDFALGFDQSTVTASAPSKVNLIVNITRSGGFTGNVTITPGEITAKGIKLPTDPVATTGGSVKFKVKLKGNAQPGSYPITFTGKDDSGKTRTVTATLVIL